MILSFRDRETEGLYHRTLSRKIPLTIQRSAMRKLWMLDAAITINDLRIPPGNHLETLTGKRIGQHSIRINDQWRLCFRWNKGDAHDVEVTDYH